MRNDLSLNSVRSFMPIYYDGVREMERLMSVQNELHQELIEAKLEVQSASFVAICNEKSLEMLEHWYRILPEANMTIDDRRKIVLSRIQTKLPFSLDFLINQMILAYGQGNFDIEMDYAHYTLYLDVSPGDYRLYRETQRTIQNIKPANLQLFTRVEIAEQVDVFESMEKFDVAYFRVSETTLGNQLETYSNRERVTIS